MVSRKRHQMMALFEEHKSRPDLYYHMDKETKGLIIIINNNEFKLSKKPRKGSNIDVECIRKLHKTIGKCLTYEKQNLTAYQISEFLKEVAGSGKKAAYYAIFIMSHGGLKDYSSFVVGTDKSRISAKAIINIFAVAPHLKDVPVLIFFHMCRGNDFTESDMYEDVQLVEEIEGGLSDESDDTESNDDENYGDVIDDDLNEMEQQLVDELLDAFPYGDLIGDGDESVEEIEASPDEDIPGPSGPVQEYTIRPQGTPNMLVSFSAVKGFATIRDVNEGSWYIQILSSIFRKYAHTNDVIELMTDVHLAMSRKRPRTRKYRNYRFAARTSHTLDKKLYFFPGI